MNTTQNPIEKENQAFSMITELLLAGNVKLFHQQAVIGEEDEDRISDFLSERYALECIDYPYSAPEFDSQAAFWGAKTVYLAAQVMLFREQSPSDLKTLLADYSGAINPSAVLSADLCLRYLPAIVFHLRSIDPEDPVIAILENHLNTWHYSNVKNIQSLDRISFENLFDSDCLKQLYIDRIILHQNEVLYTHPDCQSAVKNSLGAHASRFWKTLIP